MLTEYGTPEMLSSMKLLRAYQRTGIDFPKRFTADLLSKSLQKDEQDRVDNLDSARRRVSQFFNKLRVLCDLGVIDENDVRLTWDSGTLTFIKDVLLPMEEAKQDALLAVGSLTPGNKAEAAVRSRAASKLYERVFSGVPK